MTPLQELADAFGIELTRPTADGSFAAVPDETLVALVSRVGRDAASTRGRRRRTRPSARRARHGRDRARRRSRGTTPAPSSRCTATADRVDDAFTVTVELEAGESIEWSHTDCRAGEVRDAGNGVVAVTVVLPSPLPHGAHRVHVARGAGSHTATLLAAPRRPTPLATRRRWGVFAPLYALHDNASPASGDLGTLRRFADWAAPHGATIVGTLPLLATFLGHGAEPCDPSPYAPVSRRFWNEVYLDAAPILGAALDEPVPGEFVDLPALAPHGCAPRSSRTPAPPRTIPTCADGSPAGRM